jgi:hypothetical protein
MSNTQGPLPESTTPPDPPLTGGLFTAEELAEIQAQLTIEKTQLEIKKLKLEVRDLPFEPRRKWFTLTLAAFGAIIAAYAAFKKAPEAPASLGVSYERSAPIAAPASDAGSGQSSR